MQHVQRWFGVCLLVLGITLGACGGDDTGGGGVGGFGGAGGSGGAGGRTGGTGGAGGTTGGAGGTTGGAGGTTGGAGGTTGGEGGMGSGGSGGETCGSTTCTTGQECVSGRCRMPCTTNSQCGAGACCDDFCTSLDDDRANCGGCGTECEPSEMCEDGDCVAAECTPPESDDDAGVEGPDIGDNGCPEFEDCVGMSAGNVCRCGDGPGCPADQHCGDDGECMCGDEAGCDTGDTCCGDECLDLDTDEDNCGECGNECLADSTCRSGVCTCPTAGETPCADGCVNADNDEDNCGGCGVECADGATCVDGDCECDNEDEIACDGECVPGNSNDNCGKCGNECDPPDYTCRKPAGMKLDCYCFSVDELDYCAQQGQCADLEEDPNNCGECGNTCDGPTSACRSGECVCPTVGQSPCGDTCVNLSNDEANCGACDVACEGTGVAMPATCTNGHCGCTNTSAVFCDEFANGNGEDDDIYQCIVPNTIWSCGECGNRCIDSPCVGGECECDVAGQTHCPEVGCIPTQTDEDNCGGCGNECPSGSTCLNSVCDCPGATSIEACEVDDELVCLDTDVDPDNCGDCGEGCNGDETCCEGGCRDAVDFEDDPDNCGECGNDCGGGCGFLGFFDCNCNNGECQEP